MEVSEKGAARLDFFRTLYTEARTATEEQYRDLEKHLAQYKGSPEMDGDGAAPATTVRNITYELVESQVSSYLPTPAVTPVMWSEKNERNAKSIETLLKNKRNELPFEKLNDMDERFNPIYGGSVWLIEWDNSILTHDTVGDVKISCLSPKRFTGQPGIYNIEDMEYCFIEFETTKEDIVRKYGVTPSVAEDTESDESADDKTATLYVCYYKNENDKICQYIWSAETELSDTDDYFARKRSVCKKCGKRKELCNCQKPDFQTQNEEYEEPETDIPLSDGTSIPAMSVVIKDGQVVTEMAKRQVYEADGTPALDTSGGVFLPLLTDMEVPKTERTRLPFYTMDTFPIVIRKNTSEEDKLLGQSDCAFVRPQQQAINKLESRIMEKLIGGGVFPIVPKDYTGDLDNSIYRRVFRADQSNFNLYGRVDLQVDISRDVMQADRLYDHAKRVLGISDSYQGQYDASAQSGKAKQIQVQQAAGRLDSKRQMKNAAYAEIDRIIFKYYLAYADEPRPALYIDEHGRRQNIMFNRYDFIERDEAGEYYYNDEYLFAADASIDVDKSRDLLWQENRQNFQSGAYGDPAMPQTQLIFWQNMEKAHYPWAHDNVERIKAEIARQQELAMMQEQLGQAQAALGQTQAELGQARAEAEDLRTEVQNRAGYEEYLLGQMKGQ